MGNWVARFVKKNFKNCFIILRNRGLSLRSGPKLKFLVFFPVLHKTINSILSCGSLNKIALQVNNFQNVPLYERILTKIQHDSAIGFAEKNRRNGDQKGLSESH